VRNDFVVRLKETNFLTIFKTETDTVSFTSSCVKDRHVRNVDCCFLLYDTALDT
ncbi:hypothetical protein VCHENC02_0474B, partial [Vibrio harveyi]